jgi:hypothetical protein
MLHATCAISIDIDQFTTDTELFKAIRASSWAFLCFFAELALCGMVEGVDKFKPSPTRAKSIDISNQIPRFGLIKFIR